MKVSDMLEDAVVYETPEYTLVITCPDDVLEESVIYQDILHKGEATRLAERREEIGPAAAGAALWQADAQSAAANRASYAQAA